MAKMKYIFLVALLGGILSGCNSWLDVKPQDKMTGKQLFDTKKGYEKALNGLYLNLGTRQLYGANLSCGFMDILGQLYLVKSSLHSSYQLATYNYKHDNVKAIRENIWKSAYKIVVNANLLYNELPQSDGILSAEEAQWFQGEVLGMRAFLHFEMFRLFGPVYSESTKNELSIPYYDRYTTSSMPLLTADSVRIKVLRDIDSALVCLKNDPVLKNGRGNHKDYFWSYRHFRMNYYAVLALKARVCLHFGQKEEAHRIATMLLTGKDPETGEQSSFKGYFPIVNSESVVSSTNPDRFFFSEMLFCIDNQKRDELHRDYFTGDLKETSILQASSNFIKELYLNENLNDIRYVQLWNSTPGGDKEALFKKFEPISNDNNPLIRRFQPIFRLGELYLIAAETAPDDETRLAWLEQLRLNRGYQNGNTTGRDPEILLKNETIREFYGEGQYFYYLKRKQQAKITNQMGEVIDMAGKYELPLPDSEVNNR